MIIDEQYEQIHAKIEELRQRAKHATSGEYLAKPSEDQLQQVQKVTNELQTVLQATISRFRKTGVFRYGLSEEAEESDA